MLQTLLSIVVNAVNRVIYMYFEFLTKTKYGWPDICLFLVYKGAISQTRLEINKFYYRTCEKTFKERYNNHTTTFRNKSKQKSTELYKHIWELKENSFQDQITWDIASRTRPYNGWTRERDLCLTEKLTIAKSDSSSLLKTRDEFISKCSHINKFTVKCFKISQ